MTSDEKVGLRFNKTRTPNAFPPAKIAAHPSAVCARVSVCEQAGREFQDRVSQFHRGSAELVAVTRFRRQENRLNWNWGNNRSG